MANKRIDYVIGFNADTSKLSNALKQLEGQLNNIASGKTKFISDATTKDITNAKNAALELNSYLNKAINVDTGKLDLSRLADSIQRSEGGLQGYLNKLSSIGPEGAKAFFSLANAISEAEMPLKRSSELMDKLWITMKNTIRWQVTSGLLTGFTSGISDAVRYAQDLNKSLNNIRIVTGKSTAEMAQFAKQANRTAKELNTTTTKYTDASLIYYQQGLDDKEVKARTDVTAKFANVSRENLTTSSEYLTAIWNNFAKGSKNLEYFADVIVALGAATASSSQEIATGLNRFAATAETVGLSYEYATAALATVTATTRQSAEVVGTAFKTLFSRIQDLELGKTLDDGTTLGKYSKALDAVGVSIKDSNGELRDMDRILDDIGGKWDTLNKDEQVALAQAVGGIRQYTQFIALMDNWDFMKENLETAKGATGELQKQADIFAESWEAARKNVKASAEGIYDSLVKDEFWIDLTNGFADALKQVEILVDSLGGLKGVLSALGILGTKLLGDKMRSGLRDIAYNTKVLLGLESQRVQNFQSEAAKILATQTSNWQGTTVSISDTALRTSAIDYQIKLQEAMAGFNEDQRQAMAGQIALVKKTQELAFTLLEVAANAKAASNALSDTLGERYATVDASGNQPSVEEQFNSIAAKSEQLSVATYLKSYLNRRGTLMSDKTVQRLAEEYFEVDDLDFKRGIGQYSTKDKFKEFLTKRIAEIEKEIEEATKEVLDANKYTTGQSGATDEKARKKDIEKVKAAGQEAGQSNIAAAFSASDAMRAQNETLNGEIPKVRNLTRDWAANVVDLSSAFFKLNIAIGGLRSFGRVITDEDMTASEKISTSIQTIAFTLPTIISLLKEVPNIGLVQAGTAKLLGLSGFDPKDLENFEPYKKALNKLTNGNIIGATAEQKFAAATKAASAAVGKATLTILPYAAILGALALVIYEVAEAIETNAERTKALNEQYNTLKDNYESVKSATQELTSSLDALGEQQTKLAGLTKGTQEWKDAVKDVNSEVLELIRKYPQLAKYVDNKDGILNISEYGRNEVIKAKRQEQYAAERSMNIAAIAKNQQELVNLQNSAKVTLAKEFKDNSSTYGTVLNKQDTLKLIDAIQKSGDWILSSTSELNRLGFTSEQQVKSIQENSNKVLELSGKIQANIEATSVLVSALLNESYDEEEIPDSIKNALSDLYSNNESDYQDKTSYDKHGLAKAYEENVSGVISARAATWKNGIYVTYANEDGTPGEEKFVSMGAGTDYLRTQNSQGKFAEKYGEVAKNLYEQYGEELAAALIEYSGNTLDINDLDPETYNQLKNLGSNILQGVVNSLGQGAATGLDSQLEGYNETYHNRIKYLGSDLGKAFNERDNILGNIVELQAKLKDVDEGSEDYKNIESQINELTKSLSENADTIKLSINSSLREDVDEAFDIAKSFDTLQDKIANGLEMTTDEVVDLIDSGYGALLQNCEATSEGLISLNQNVVDAYVAQKKEEVEVDKQAKIAQLKTQRELLVVQKEALEKKLQLLDAAANADDARTAARYLAEAMMQQAIADDAAEQAAAVVGTDVEKSKALTDDAKAVADYVNDTLDATTNTAIDSNLGIAQSTYQLSQDVISYWNNMAEARANYFKINENNTVSNPVSVTAGAPNVGTYGPHQNTEDVEIFDSSKLSDPQAVEDQIKKWTEGILERAKNNVDAIKDAASAMMGDSRKELDLVLSQIGSIDAAIARINGNMIDSVVGGKDKGGSGSSKEAKDTAEALKEVLERYHEITREIEYQKELLDDISTAADRAYGTDKIEMLTQKIEKLNKVAELQSQKQAAAAGFVISDLEAIRANGLAVEYDTASMELKNYTQLLQQITDEYNSRINSVSEDQRDMVQKEYDDKMQLLENYEDSIDTFREQLNEYEDAMRQIEDTKLEKVKEALQIRIDWKEMQDTLREFQKEINESIGDALDNGVRNAGLNAQGVKDEISMFADYETKMNSLLDMIRNANQYTDVQALQDELADLRKELVDSGSAMLDYIETLKEALPDALDAAADRFEEFISMLESNMGVLDAMNDLIDLQTINNSLADKYAMLSKTYSATLENSLTQAKLQKQYMERAETQLREAEIALANATQGTAEYDILKGNRDALLEDYQKAQDAMLEATAQAMQAAKNIYSNALDDIFYEFENKMTRGLGFDQLQAKYNRTKDEDNRFLDGVNRFVETQDLNNKVQESIAKASTDYAKSTLKALQDEFAERQANIDLSEYDLKIMKAKYNMTLKQIALEEAQNAKSKVRLVRGANGNYNYLFTADEANINSKQQEYLKAMQDYYNIAKDQTENITGEIVSLWQEMSEEIRKIYEDDTLNAEQRQNAINEIQAYYQKKYADLAKMQVDAAKDMKDAGNAALDEQQKVANQYGDNTSETAQNFQKNFQRILEEMGGNVNDFNSAYSDQLINLVAIEGSFTETTAEMFAKLNEALTKYKGNISNISSEIGVSYDQLSDKVDRLTQANEELQNKAILAIDEIWNKISELQDVTEAQAAWTKEVYNTIAAIQKLASETATAVQKYNEAVSNIQSLAATGSYMADSLNSAASNMNNTSGGGYPSSPKKPQETPVNKTRVREQLGQFAYDGQIYKSLTQNGAVYEGGGWWNFYPENRSRLKTIIATTKNGNKGKSFATGGYTGEWSNGDTEGRVAMLHQKELVLNKTDTENMLAAVQAIRDFSPELIASIRAKLSAVSLASQSLMGSRLASSSPDFSKEPTELAQNVNINADFPGVRDAIEIKEALESLVQTSAQRINFYTK